MHAIDQLQCSTSTAQKKKKKKRSGERGTVIIMGMLTGKHIIAVNTNRIQLVWPLLLINMFASENHVP